MFKYKIEMHLEKPVLGSSDLIQIQEIYTEIRDKFPDKSNRLIYFVAACDYFSGLENFDYEIALKLRPYGGLIGIDNSSWDKYLKRLKVLRLHAILHDAGGFIYELGPGYSYMIPCKINSFFSGHVTGILFCLYLKLFKWRLFQSMQC